MVSSHLQVVKQRLLVNVLPEDLGDCIEEAVKDRHQKKLILLTASQLSNKTVMLGDVINHWCACHTPEMLNAEDIETDSSKKLLNDWLRNENVQIIKRSSQYHIKEEVHARLIKAGEAVQHDDLSICLDHLIES